MDAHLRAAWTRLVTADDNDGHMAAVGLTVAREGSRTERGAAR